MPESSSASPASVSFSQGLTPELLNQLTHGAGLLLSIPAAIHLISQPMDSVVWVGNLVYVFAFVLLLAASTLSHTYLTDPDREWWRTVDQFCIFLFMAAVYTPVSLHVCRDGLWNIPLILMWVTAIAGCLAKVRVTGTEMVPVWYYLLVGFQPLICVTRLWHMGPGAIGWIAAGAACYLVGVWFLMNDHRRWYFHAIWHVLVMSGMTCQYMLILKYTTL